MVEPIGMVASKYDRGVKARGSDRRWARGDRGEL